MVSLLMRNRKIWKKFWTIPQNFQNIEVILFLIAMLKAIIHFLNCQNNFKGSKREKGEDLLLSAYRSFSYRQNNMFDIFNNA